MFTILNLIQSSQNRGSLIFSHLIPKIRWRLYQIFNLTQQGFVVKIGQVINNT